MLQGVGAAGGCHQASMHAYVFRGGGAPAACMRRPGAWKNTNVRLMAVPSKLGAQQDALPPPGSLHDGDSNANGTDRLALPLQTAQAEAATATSTATATAAAVQGESQPPATALHAGANGGSVSGLASTSGNGTSGTADSSAMEPRAVVSGTSGPQQKEWYAAVALSALAALICSVDRAAISVAILPMSQQFDWSDTTKGAINSAFYIGYTITNLVGGYLASSLSAKQVLGWGVVVWSLFTITTPIAASSTLPVLLANRAAMGAGEGVTFPCVQNIVKFWVPADVRTRALTLIYSGGSLGTIVALVTAPLIINAFGWPAVFEVYGSLGLFWMLAWQKLVSDTPPFSLQQAQQQQQALQQRALPAADKQQQLLQNEQQQQKSALELQQQQAALVSQQQALQQQQQQQQQPSAAGALPRIRDLPWKSFFTNRAFLAILMAHSAFGVGHYVCLSWLPTYYNQEFGVDVQQSALLSVLPWFCVVLVNNTSGWLADGLANSGRLSMTHTRKLLQTLGSVGPAFCLLYLALAHEDPGELQLGEAVALLTAIISLGGFQSAGFASNHQDISSRYASVLFGISNATSSLMGTASVYATGLILDATHSWSLVFEIVAVCYLVGAGFFVALASAEQQFE